MTIRVHHTILPSIGICFLVIHWAGAQTEPISMDRYIQFGARADAFAGAYATETRDISSMYWNPAAISFVENRSLLWDYLFVSDGKFRAGMIATPLFSGTRANCSVGMTVSQSRFEGVDEAYPVFTSAGADIAYSYALDPTVSMGLLGSMKHHWTDDTQRNEFAGAIGFLYVPGPDISYGIIYRGIGSSLTYSFLPDGQLVIQRIPMRKNLQLGITMNFPSTASERIFSLSLSNDKTFGQPGIRYCGALEWCLSNVIELRTGYTVSPQVAGPRYGIGVHTSGIEFDYAISPSLLLNRFQELTFSFFL